MALLRRHQQLYACLWLLLLLAVAFPPAPMVVAGDAPSYWTAMHVPSWCRAEFIQALWNNDPRGIRPKCCIKLVCVHDPDCFKVLMNFCDYDRCFEYCRWIPPLRTSNSSKPAVPPPPGPGHHH